MMACPMIAIKRLITTALSMLILAALVYPCFAASPSVSSPTPHYRRVGSGENAYYEIDYYTVSSAAQLRGLASLLSPEGPVYITADIWLNPDENPTETEFTPIGGENRAFVGTIDGMGHTIHNLYVNQPDKNSTGLIGRMTGSISNLTVTGSVTGHTDAAGVVGYLDRGSISNVVNKVTVNGYLEVGGVVGYTGGSVTNSENYGTVTATYGAGGVAGSSSAAIKDCANYGDISVTETAAGGITSASSGTITNCRNYGSVDSNQQSGGVVGALNGQVTGCVNYGTITGDFYIGGISSRIYTGGKITQCYNYGHVEAKNMAGGVTGYNDEGTIDSCHNRKDITANIMVAGIAGYNKGTITNCTSTGKITSLAEEYTGGIAGENDGQIEGSYVGEGSADAVTGSEDSSTGTETESGVKDDAWFNVHYPADQEPGEPDNPDNPNPGGDEDAPGGEEPTKETIIISQDMTIEENEKYTVDENTNVVIPGDVTVTNNGTLENDGQVTIKDQGKLIIDSTGEITGNGVIVVEDGGKVINNSTKPITVTDEDGNTIVIQPGDTHTSGEEPAKETIIISQDIIIEENEKYTVGENTTVVIPGGVTVTNNGTLENDGQVTIKDQGELIIDSTGEITGNGVIVVEDGGKVVNNSGKPVTVTDEEGNTIVIQPGDSHAGGEDTKKETIIISENMTIEENEKFTVDENTNVVIPGGVTVTDKGTLENNDTVTIQNQGALVIDKTGEITGDGVIIVENGGKVINNSTKPVTVTDEDGNTIVIQPGESHTEGEENPDIKPDKILETDTTIPEGETYPVAPDESLVIPDDVTLTVEGTLDNDGTTTVQDGGTIHVTDTGSITGGGTIVVQPGGTIINDGKTEFIVVTGNGGTETVSPGQSYTDQPQIYVIAQSDTGGSISPAGKITVNYGGSLTFNIKPQSGCYEIENVAVNGIAVGAVSSYTMSDIKESSTIQAFFKKTGTDGGIYVSDGGSGCNATHASAALAPCTAALAAAAALRRKKDK